jgi:hypothetical protein
MIGVIMRRERSWTSAGETPALGPSKLPSNGTLGSLQIIHLYA